MRLLAIFVLFCGGILSAQTAPASPDPLQPIAWMAGGTWHGELKGPDGAVLRIDTRIERELDGHALEFTTRFNDKLQYHGFFAWDGAKKNIVMSYAAADGAIVSGMVSRKGGLYLWDFQDDESDGSSAKYQVQIHRDGADDYTWALFAPFGGSAKKLFEVRYHRNAA